MHSRDPLSAQHAAAIDLLKLMRQIDMRTGVRNSRIAFDVALMFFEDTAQDEDIAFSVGQIADRTHYSGPTVRLVLRRLISTRTLMLGKRLGKTQFYRMTAKGRAGIHEYIDTLLAFRGSLTREDEAARIHSNNGSGEIT